MSFSRNLRGFETDLGLPHLAPSPPKRARRNSKAKSYGLADIAEWLLNLEKRHKELSDRVKKLEQNQSVARTFEQTTGKNP